MSNQGRSYAGISVFLLVLLGIFFAVTQCDIPNVPDPGATCGPGETMREGNCEPSS